MIVLAIVSLVLALSLSAFKGPSPAMQVQRLAAEIAKAATETQNRAIRDQRMLTLDIEDQSCDPSQNFLIFYPDGTAVGPDLCFGAEKGSVLLRLALSPLSGRFLAVTQ